MAKTIKFNLICDGEPIRTIEDLQNNFSIEDVLEYYNNRLLHRWLKIRGFTDELEKVSKITSSDEEEIIKELIKLFNVESDENEIEESISIWKHVKESQKLREKYKIEKNSQIENIITYKEGYERLVRGILLNPDNITKIKKNIANIMINYELLFKLNYRELFYVLKDQSALAIMCLLMNEKSRPYYIQPKGKTMSSRISSDPFSIPDKVVFDKTRSEMYKLIRKMIADEAFKNKLGDNLIQRSVTSLEKDKWQNIEPGGKKYMLISIGCGDNVRPVGKNSKVYSSIEIENQFIILDGIDYRVPSSWSKSSSFYAHSSNYRQVTYMEV